ncbi:MAG: anaerobic ribonucleoside triphosphate reductase [Anaerobacillus sp.]|uniref:anaerobic ribonucleoside triphosphate reductase n=1 Tax=Anaerobacillus sp. TaxID=1872506 RepID=UPI00391CACF0
MLKGKEIMQELIDAFKEIIGGNEDLLRENANVDGSSPLGKMNKLASESGKWFANQFLLSEEVKKALDDNILYIHDRDYYSTGTTTCCQIPLDKLLKKEFNTGHGTIRSPKSIKTAMALASIIFQSNQNTQHGGQSYQKIDYDLAPYVKLTYEAFCRKFSTLLGKFVTVEEIERLAWTETKEETFQACEAFIHNANSMHSRGGGQVPFVSINFGTDTSKEGRLVTEQLLKATKRGLGNGETPIFPIQIFKVKEGINFHETDPNYDLFQLAIETTSERLFPNFSFIDAPFNKQYDNGTPESEVAYMGCRTRVMSNINGPENSVGRGNLSFSTINLVKLALLAKGDVNAFFISLDEAIITTIKQLLERFEYQASKTVGEFGFLYSQGVWKGSEQLERHDTLKEVLKQGSLSVGFIGLAEALTALIGKHHGESTEAWELGKRIIAHMRDRTDEETEQTRLNFGVIATPAEGLSGKFVKADQQQFGMIEGVTNKQYYTNSFHIPVDFSISIFKKIKLEAPFHHYCNAGHITYIELDGNARENLKAIQKIVEEMKDNGIGYGSINHPIDRCTTCGYNGIIGDRCPSCNEDDTEKIERIRRITGYLVGDLKRWNRAKRNEEKNRVKHR